METTALFCNGDGGRDDAAAGPSWLGYYKHQTASPRPTANITRATCASPAPTYDAHT